MAFVFLTICAHRYPDEVVITDVPAAPSSSGGTNTPNNDEEDDFFSSWDKPSIKRPSNPPSRTGTPSVTSRTASPYLNSSANGNGSARPKSPLSATSDKDSTGSAPTAIKSGTAVRKAPAAGSAKKAGSVLGAKKAPKLGAKKVGGGAETVDFDEAEKKAKEEAERIERLGYNPEVEEPPATEEKDESPSAGATAAPLSTPAPAKPTTKTKTGTSKKTSTTTSPRNSNDVDRLGMGVRRLGFGQVTRPPAPKTKKLGGFGSVGPARSAADSMCFIDFWQWFCAFIY